MQKTDLELLSTAQQAFMPYRAGVKRKAQGAIPYDYLVPAGYYEEQWDWDGFFVGLALAQNIPSEAIFLKNWVLNFLHNADKEGYTAGCVSPKGPEKGHRSFPMKPFIAQGAYFASIYLKDFGWLDSNYDKLVNIVMYRIKTTWNDEYNLATWNNAMESGADNNLAAFDFPNKTVIATDLNSFLYREFKALSYIASKLNRHNDAKKYISEANNIRDNINKYLWNKNDNAYYNLDSSTGKQITCISYSSAHPIWAGLSSDKQAKTFIEKYVLNKNKLLSRYGIRSQAKDDSRYNNANIIKPYSNWQGPVWPIVNFFFIYPLIKYGYQKEAIDISKKVALLCINDIKNSGGMHENYNAETGEPLAAPNFISWNLLTPIYLEDAINNKVSFEL